jgi:phospholipase C
MANSPIEHVVVLMLENHSFDNIFGFRKGVNGLSGTEYNLLNPAKPESSTNPRFSVNDQSPYRIVAGAQGPGHSLKQTNEQLFGVGVPKAGQKAALGGFIQAYKEELFMDHVPQPTPAALDFVMQSYTAGLLPSIYALADNFVLCDAWHSEVPGPTQPNRLYMHAATSFGYVHNVWTQQFGGRTIYNQIQEKGLTWATYEFDQNEVREFTQVNQEAASFKQFEESFSADIAAGTLANYSFILPRFMADKQGRPANSQHAPEDMRYGDNFIADVYEALRANDAVWNKTALIVTYDEHGGFYDHVVPPSAPNPDGIDSPAPGDTNASFVPPFAFDRLGLRVPALIVSPWVDAGRVDSTQYQHTSVLATVQKLFQLNGSLTKRDRSAASFEGLFCLSQPRTTPLKLPRVALPQAQEPGDPENPANQALNDLQSDWVHRTYHLTRHPEARGYTRLPITQGDASQFIQKRYLEHFGPHGQGGVLPKSPQSPGGGSPAKASASARAKGGSGTSEKASLHRR